MEFILHIVLALLSVGAADLGWAGDRPQSWAVGALVFLPHALALLARRAQYGGRFRLAALLERVLVVSPFLLQLLAVTWLGWLGSVEKVTGTLPTLSEWPGLELLAGIAPFLVYQLVALHARTLLRDPRTSDRRALFWFQARMLLSGAAPFAIYVGLSALFGARDEVRVRLEEVSLYNTLFTLALLGVFLGFLPLLLRNTWSTTRMPQDDVRDLLEDVARKSGFEYRELLRWNTGGQMANAAIVGFTRRTRVVLFTDALLQLLHPREIAAVFAHEIGHARRRHAATFVVFVVIVFVGVQVALDLGAVEDPWVALGLLGGLLALWLVLFGYLSRRFELDADLASLETIGDPLPLASALLRVTGAHAHERDGWRHFSTARRVRFLAEAAGDPDQGRRLRRTLSRWSRGATLLALALVLVWCTRLIQMRPEEELVADLRLGHWDRAAARLADGLEVEAEVEGLVRTAAALDERLPAADLLVLALGSAQAAELLRARELLELAALRGAPSTQPGMELLDELRERAPALEGDRPGLQAWLQERPAAWRADWRARLDADWTRVLIDPPAAEAEPRPGGMLRR